MTPSRTHTPSALMAHQILEAMECGNLTALESGLARAESLAGGTLAPDSARGERAELLGAVAGQMRRSIRRFSRRLTPHVEGMEVYLQLLHHLAREAPRHRQPVRRTLAVSAL